MSQELNQVQEEIENDLSIEEIDSLLFEEDEIEKPFVEEEVEEDKPIDNETDETSEVEDEQEEDQGSQEDTQEEEQDTNFLTVKFNKEDVNVSKEDAITYVQKGMNYDKMVAKFEPTFNEISRLASANGMSVEQYLNELNQVQETFALNNEITSLRTEFPDADDKLLEELAKARLNSKPKPQDVVQQQENEQEAARKKEIGRQLDLFAKRYPNVNPQQLDKKVYELMKEGYTLLEAYESVRNDNLLSEQKAKEIKEKNRRRSLGNTTNSEDMKEDLSHILFDDD